MVTIYGYYLQNKNEAPLTIRMTDDLILSFDEWPSYLDVYRKIWENSRDEFDMMFCLKYDYELISITNFDSLRSCQPIELKYSRFKSVPLSIDDSSRGEYSRYYSALCCVPPAAKVHTVSAPRAVLTPKAVSAAMRNVLKGCNIENRNKCMVFGEEFPDLPTNTDMKKLLLEHCTKQNSHIVVNCHLFDELCNVSHRHSTGIEFGVWYGIDYFLKLFMLSIFYDPFKQKYYLISMNLDNE